MIKIEITGIEEDDVICSFIVNANSDSQGNVLSELEFCQITNRKQNEKDIETIQVMADVSFE